MFKRKMILLSLLIIGLLAFSSVSAGDINETVVASENQNSDLIEIDDENVNDFAVEEQEVYNIGATEENELSATAGTFTDLANDIASSDYELNLTRDYIYSSGDSKYVQGIKIDKKITINGNGFTINGNNQSRAFFVSFSKVIINNISFLNCYSTNDGGAVYWTGNNGFLDNCNFVNCFSYSLSSGSGSGSGSGSSYGGAIYWSGSEGILRNCSFVNCTTFSNYSYSYKSTSSHGFGSSSSYSYGGAVYWNGVNGSLLNCQFIYCSSLSNSNFSSNIYLTSGSSSSYSYGGAVYWNGVNGSLLDCIYWNCSSNSISDSSYKYASTHSNSYGGAVYWNGVNGSLLDCIYWNCSSNSDSNFAVTSGVSSKYCSSYGGAICWRGVNGSLLDCNFVNCFVYSSTGMGGSVYWSGSEGILCNCSFVNCLSFLLGDNYCSGAIYWGGSNGSLLDCSFVNCSCIVEGSSSYSGGTVYWSGSGGLLCNCSFVNCSFVSFGSGSISYNGGTVYWSGSGGLLCNCSFINSSFSNSKSKYISHIGGTVYWSGSGGLLCNCSFINSFFSKTGSNIGGAIYWGGNNGSIFSCSFVNCCSDNYKYIFWKGLHGILMNCSFNGDKYNYQLYCYVESKLNSNLNIQVNNSNIYEIHKILINVAPILNNVTFKVSDTSKNIIVYESNVFIKDYFELLLSNLTRGNYSVKVEHLEDDFYSSNSVIKNFNVNGLTPNINSSDIKGILAGNNLIYNVTLNDDAKGTVSVSILNKTFEGNIIGGKCIININDIIGGVYEYIIKYSGDDKYNDYSLVKLTNVSFKDSTLDFNIHNVSFGDNIFINPIINSGPTGNITVFLDNIYYTNFNIGETATIENLKAGNYSITLAYNGDNYYAPNEKTKIVGVQKINSTLNVLYNKLIAGDTVINITLNNKTTGNITFFINNKNYTKILVNGKTNICFNDLSVGDYNYSVSYPGDNNFNKNNISGILSIQSKKSNIYLSAYNVICGENISINYGGVFGLTSIIDIYVDENFIKNVSVGQEIKLSDMSAGKHVVKIICNSDGFYATCSNITNVTVFEKSYINLEVHDINFEDSIILKPIVTNGATGEIKIYVDNIYKTQINVGKTYTLSNLKGGNHTIRLAYSGDDYFAPCENTTILNVNKINTTISSSPTKAIAGNTVLNIVLNNKASGNITVNVNNKKYNETLSGGKCTVYIYDLPAGNYEYTIDYNGDQNFNQNTYKNDLNIQSKESAINISSNNIYVDEIAKINYTLTSGATGILSVYVNNEFVKNVSVGNNIELENLPYSNYTVKVIYNSDGYYATCQNTTTFKVQKLNPTFSFTKNNAIAGDEFVITYILNIDATGTIICNNSTKQLINGRVNFNINNIKGGLHQFNISYSGDDKYNPINKTVNVTIKFKDAIVDFDVKDIIWSDSLTIAPTLTAGATGLLNIYIDNNLNSTININGRKDFTFYVGGYHYIKVSYSGDEYYASNSTTKWFNVIKLNSTCDIKGNIETDNSATVYVTLNEDATGEVNIYIKGTKYTSDLIEGVATFRVPSLAAGTYDVTIDYEGDTKYASIYTTKSLEVTLKPSTITLNVKNILTGNNLVITPIVTSSASGNLKIYVDNVLKKTIAIGSSYTIENPAIGSHSVRVVYAGDSYHQGNETKTTFRVFTFYPIEVQNSAIIYGMDKHFQAIVYDEYGDVAANKPVAFRINGEDTVVVADSNGLAVFNKDLPIGTYYVSIINVYVNEAHTYTLKVFTSIESENMTRAYNTGMDFKVKLLDENGDTLSRGYAIFNINNKDYPVVTDNDGVAVLNANLPVGTYTVTTTNGRTGETKTNKITIVPSVEATNMVRGYNSGVDFKAKFLDADAKPLVNQKVTFKIGFTEYEATTDANGFAVLNEQLDVGKYEVTAINKVTGERATRNLTIVERIVENNNVIRIYGEESYYTIHIVGDDGSFVGENEIVNININNIDYQIRTNNNGYASFRIDENIGSYDILAEYKEYEVCNEVYVLERVNYIKNLNVTNINYKQIEVVSLNLSSFDNFAYVEFEVVGDNGYNRIFDQSAGNSITLPITNLNAGKYTVTAKYYDLNTHKFSSMAKTFIINKIDPKIIIVVEDANVDETATITVNIPDVEGNVEIKVGTALTFNEYLVKNGVIIKEIDSLPAGTYNVDVTYVGDNNYNRFTQSANLTITQPKTLTKISASDITITQGKGSTLIATLKDIYGNVLVGKGVSIYFNGLNSILNTDKNGQVKLNIANNLSPKTYSAIITFVEDDYYVGSKITAKVTVNKAPVPKTTLTLKTVKVKKSAKKLVLQATLKQGKNPLKNKKITFKFNGKTYKAKTNKKGIAKIIIKNSVLKKLKVGKKIKYQASYGNAIAKKTAKIRK